jgi:hypothetical protein
MLSRKEQCEMATAVGSSIPQPHLTHVFEQLASGCATTCELCHEQCAVFHWAQQGIGKTGQTKPMAVCRVCAGMILLIGKS